MNFEKTDRMLHLCQGFWDETLARWYDQGLPKTVDPFEYFDVSGFAWLPVAQEIFPLFDEEILEEHDDFLIMCDERGRIIKNRKDKCSMPMWLEYPINNRNDYEKYRERFDAKTNGRYPGDWEQQVSGLQTQQNKILAVHIRGFFGFPREYMGLEKMLLAYYDDPEFIQTIINDRLEFVMKLYEKALTDVIPDFAFIWEDMAYKNGSLISPELFDHFAGKAYKKLIIYLKDFGIKIIFVDSDGNNESLIPFWLKNGVTGHLPFECAAGMDVVRIGKQHPKLQILGGIDKMEIAKGKKAIDVELQSKLQLMKERSGYIVSLDHWVNPEISLENYRYFVEAVKKV